MNFSKLYKNPTNRILWLVLVGYFLVSAYFTIWTYYRQSDLSEKSALLRLEGIVNSLALQINGDLHHQLTQRYQHQDEILFNTQDTDYYTIHHALRMNYEANMLKSPVYTMVFDSIKLHFEFIATSSDTPYFRHIYDSFNPILKRQYTEGGVIPMYKDRFGMWLSAFAPIRDARGNPVGVVMADENFEKFVGKAQSLAVKNLLISLFIILPVILLLIYWLRRLIFREARMKKSLEEAYENNLQMSHQLEESLEKLSSIDKLRKEMIANISHDLRTPLTSLSGYIETLFMRRHTIKMDERERYLTIAIKESERLKKLIDDLFELSKLESNQIKMTTEPLPIAELLQDVMAKYEVICKEKNIKLTSNLSENTPWVVADLKLIDRVLQNLLDNAIRYNFTEGGKVDLLIKTISAPSKMLEIKISNTGETIDPSVLPHIFDRYFKTLSMDGSTGLGLAIVKKILELHNCDIRVESHDNLTTFIFSLPVYLSVTK
jgi:signal transduction histidine kinase